MIIFPQKQKDCKMKTFFWYIVCLKDIYLMAHLKKYNWFGFYFYYQGKDKKMVKNHIDSILKMSKSWKICDFIKFCKILEINKYSSSIFKPNLFEKMWNAKMSKLSPVVT